MKAFLIAKVSSPCKVDVKQEGHKRGFRGWNFGSKTAA